MNPIKYLQQWRAGYTGITGLGEFQNNVKMILLLFAPFLGMWIGAQFTIAYYQIPPQYAVWILAGVLGAWVLEAVAFWAYTSTDANKYKVWPQTPTFMPDGGVPKFTFKIPQGGIHQIDALEGGKVGVHVDFADRYLYRDTRMPFPYPFESMYVVLPAKLGGTFKFLSDGEFWHKGMVVETPNCEHISLYVSHFVEEHGRFKPVAFVSDCTHRHEAFRHNGVDIQKVLNDKGESLHTLYNASLQRENELVRYAGTLEERIEAQEIHGRKYIKSVKAGLGLILKAIATWDELQEPLIKRIFTWKNIIFALIVIFGIIIFLQVFMGVKLF